MINLDDTYRRLAQPSTSEQLAAHYHAAHQHRPRLTDRPELARPIPRLATAIPPSATLSTTIHTLHVSPGPANLDLPQQLLDIAQRNIAHAVRACEDALALDGAEHDYTIDDWLPTVYDIADSLLRSARPNTEPPTVIQAAQEAISWLSRAIAELDADSKDAPTSLAETLARLLVVRIFTDAALHHQPLA